MFRCFVGSIKSSISLEYTYKCYCQGAFSGVYDRSTCRDISSSNFVTSNRKGRGTTYTRGGGDRCLHREKNSRLRNCLEDEEEEEEEEEEKDEDEDEEEEVEEVEEEEEKEKEKEKKDE
ncbi:hypothetical protein HZH66_014211 [Vespula vulgaris]|uniref:Uncharacterized protein n=1 Tax=Vespula vulgaris TaxID=7454 RepID=A0A834MQ01_VESVU|nr:hypothetical protein HZH66_014211 [Vespula vulgaris]